MATEQEELQQLLALLKLEKEEDFEQHKKLVQQLPLHERVNKGYTWYAVQVVKSGYALGERAFVIVEKSNEEQEHHFRSGKAVNFFTQQANVSKPERSGVIHYVNKNRMKIILNSKDLPDWLDLGQLGVDLMFDETTYLEMEKALHKVSKAQGDRLADLRSILLGKSPARFGDLPPVDLPQLNTSQQEAIRHILGADDAAIVHGPPGTGKTTTLVQAVKLLCETESTVLVCAPSNTAVDLLTEKLAEQGLNVVRIGNLSRVDEFIIPHTLDMRLSAHPDSKNIKKVKIDAADTRRKAQRFKRKFGPEGYQERRRLFKEASELMAWANQLEDRLIDQILDGAQVITCTLVGAANKILNKRKFRTVVIDEAAQALEPATWIPILRASRVVLTGDPFQLPPTVKSNEAQRGGFGVSLIEKTLERFDVTSLLNIQYRMHEVIMGFSNQQFYEGKLQAADLVKDQRLPIPDNIPVVFIDTAGCGFEEKIREAFQSRYNPDEFQMLCEHLYLLVEAYGDTIPPSIAIISPYREQVVLMKQFIETEERLKELPITINTIDGFQGQEREIVYISLVRSNSKGEIGFLKDQRRMNVAMTRARKQLIVVGDSATIGNHTFYADFLEYCENHGEYKTAWEYMQ
ncbi:MAG: helicase [Saprospiraceae bacterium]|nr:MAG: helicase [Saprospiraceae bacterium]